MTKACTGPSIRRSPLIAAALLACSCAPTALRTERVDLASVDDGICLGSAKGMNQARVEVVVANHRIESVRILSLDASPFGLRAKDSIPDRIVAKQQPIVDVVSGASEASRTLMNASIDALGNCADRTR